MYCLLIVYEINNFVVGFMYSLVFIVVGFVGFVTTNRRNNHSFVASNFFYVVYSLKLNKGKVYY